VKAFAGFRQFPTHHCVTGSMRHIYAFNGHDLSEDLLLGLGEGVGFAYFHFKGQPPFMGGRAQPKPGMEEIAAERTGVAVRSRASGSDAAAEKALIALLEAGRPVMLQVDMGFLRYFDFGGQEYHFGGHVIAACGWDAASGTVLVADREKELHEVPLADLGKARGSRFKPFPPGRRWWEFDFSGFSPVKPADALSAIGNQAALMLCPPISNIGVKGIRKAAGEVARWDSLLSPDELRGTLFNTWIMTSAVGGTGGGLFRRMFGRFLGEAAALTALPALAEAGEDFGKTASAWDAIAVKCREAADEGTGMAARLPDISRALMAVADREEAGWRKLARVAR
jgi:hypothetical protein